MLKAIHACVPLALVAWTGFASAQPTSNNGSDFQDGNGFVLRPRFDWVTRWVPQTPAGTIKLTGFEIPITHSPARLDGPGFSLGGSMPVPALGKNLAFDFGGGPLHGSTSAVVPAGGANLAYVYLMQQAGFTGVDLGATGTRVAIDSRVDWFDASFMFKKPSTFQPFAEPHPNLRFTKGIGFDFGYRNIRHHVHQQSLTFPGVSQDTRIDLNDTFLGVKLGGGFVKDKGDFKFGASGYVTPGVRIIDGDVHQRNLCDVCGQVQLRDFRQSIQVDRTQFDVKAGAGFRVSRRLGPDYSLGMRISYDYERLGNVPLPFTPGLQPAKLDRGDSHRVRAGVYLRGDMEGLLRMQRGFE